MEKLSERRLWTLTFTTTILGVFSFFGSFFLLLSVLPEYISTLGGEAWQIGLIVGGSSVLPLVIWPFIGRWCDSGHRVRLMYFALLVTFISLLLQSLAHDVWLLFIFRVFQGLGLVAFPTAGASIIGVVVPANRRGEGIGFYGIAASSAVMVFPAVGVEISEIWGFNAVFLLSAAAAIGTILLILPLREPPRSPFLNSEQNSTLLARRALFPMAVFFTATFAFTALAAFLPELGHQRGFGNVGLFFLISGACAVVVRLLAGRASDRFGRSALVIPGLIMLAFAMLLLTFAETRTLMFVAGAINGIGFGMAHNALFALAFDRVPITQRGGATALFRSAWDSGGILGGILLGLLVFSFGVDAAFWASSGILICAVLLYLFGVMAGMTESFEMKETER